MSARKRRGVKPTHEWELLLPLFEWPEQERYEEIFETSHVSGQTRLFGLAETLGEDGWLKALRMADYAPRSARRPDMLEQVLFPYPNAV